MTKRDHKTSVTGADYVMHLPRPGYPLLVWCGRTRAAVNSYPDGYVSPYAPEEEEQTCRACVKHRTVDTKPGKHRWDAANDDTCSRCGLHREGAGAGPYGAMRYYRDGSTSYDYKPGPCPGKISPAPT